ncbi:MAG: hypothetical protein ACJ8F1_18185 [Polyangia bacterium]
MRVVLIGFFLSSAFLAVGCKQGNGDRCVQDSDCASGICSRAGVQGGQCAASTTNETGTGGSRSTGGQSGSGGGAAGEGGAAGQDAAPASDAAQDAGHDGPTSG